METNTEKKMVNFIELTDEKKQLIDETAHKCASILFDALVRASDEIDSILSILFKEEK